MAQISSEEIQRHLENKWDELINNKSEDDKWEFLKELCDLNYIELDDIFYVSWIESQVDRYFSEELGRIR